ncbi:MAG: sigma factor-like helix-turn-helix DNA-binding protein [Pirellulales bacterium]
MPLKKPQHANVASGSAVRGQKEIAALLGISRARVFQLEQRAMEKIRKAIEQEARAAGMSIREWLESE